MRLLPGIQLIECRAKEDVREDPSERVRRYQVVEGAGLSHRI